MRTIQVYKSYNFKNKDPVIDILRTAVQKSGLSYNEIQELSGVHRQTMNEWFNGETRRPKFASVQAVAHALGLEFRLVEVRGRRAHLRVVA